MFLRSLSQQPESHWDSVVQERALQLSQTFSIDWNGDINELYSSENSQAQSDLSHSQIYHSPMPGFRFDSINGQTTIDPRQIDRLQNRHNLSSNALNLHFPSSEWLNQSNNVFIISRVDHANQEDFLQAIDFLFQELAQPKHVPKFRHIMNRMKSKCAICFGKIKRCQTICKTECRHKFHKECLEKWTEKNPSCPLCRKEFK